jgi:DNA polymerase-3 subunit epsilon
MLPRPVPAERGRHAVTGLERYGSDPRFAATTFVVVDFEASTPAGFPAEPIEVGAVMLRPHRSVLVEVGRFEALMRPPPHAPVTSRQVGITAAMLTDRPCAATVLAAFDAALREPPYVTVAHHASTEANILARHACACPTLTTAPMLCTLRLARHAYPGLASYGLDAMLAHTHIPAPAGRHRALPDAVVTATLLQRLLTAGAARHGWSRLSQLVQLAGSPAPGSAAATPDTLF